MSTGSKVLKVSIPILILIAGFAGMKWLKLSRQPPQKEVKIISGALVETLTVKAGDHDVMVLGTGTVQARQQAAITPQVSGKVSYLAPDFVAGGFFKKGDLLFEIESVDYQLAIERTKATLSKAEYNLSTVESQARVARMEWDRLKLEGEKKPNPLVLYEPQLKNAQAEVASAKATLEQAKLDMERIHVYAPFDCRIRSEEIDLGQYVRAGNSVGIAAGTETAEIIVPLPLEELHWLRIPRKGSDRIGSPVTAKIVAGNQTFTWQGHIDRSLGEIDPQSRMSRVIVAVDDPYNLKNRSRKSGINLETGLFVNVALHGKKLTGVIAIPRSALRENETVWIVDKSNKLRVRPVTVVRRERNLLFIEKGLKEGEKVVLTSLSGAVEGMKLRPIEKREE